MIGLIVILLRLMVLIGIWFVKDPLANILIAILWVVILLNRFVHTSEYNLLIKYMNNNNLSVLTKEDIQKALDITYSEAKVIEKNNT